MYEINIFGYQQKYTGCESNCDSVLDSPEGRKLLEEKFYKIREEQNKFKIATSTTSKPIHERLAEYLDFPKQD